MKRLLLNLMALAALVGCHESSQPNNLGPPEDLHPAPDNAWHRLTALVVCDLFDDLVDADWLGEEIQGSGGAERDDTAWPVCRVSGEDVDVELFFYPVTEAEGSTLTDLGYNFPFCDPEEATDELGDWKVIGMYCADDHDDSGAPDQYSMIQADGPETGALLEVTSPVGADGHSLEKSLNLMFETLAIEFPDHDFTYRDPDWSGQTADEICAALDPLVDDDFLGVPVQDRLAQPATSSEPARCLLSNLDNVVDLATYAADDAERTSGAEIADLFRSSTCEKPQEVDEIPMRGVWHVYGSHCDETDGLARTWFFAVGPSTAIELQIHGAPELKAVRLKDARGLLDAILRAAAAG